jgi:guanylate kinase
MGNYRSHHSVSAEANGHLEASLDTHIDGASQTKHEGEPDGLHISAENRKFIEAHPALQRLLNDFVTEVRQKDPSDLVTFGMEYLTALHDANGTTSTNIIHPSEKISNELCPVVIAGPSGVGKGSLITRLLATYPDAFGFSVSHTTRGPRPGEVNGQHYHFVAKDDFEAALAERAFVEHALVHTNYYGTSFAAVDRVRSQGKVCILDIDIQGVQNVKRSPLQCKYLFVAPPNFEELERRLRGRNTETEEKIAVRLNNARDELIYGTTEGNFDTVLVNDDLDATFETLVQQIHTWFPALQLQVAPPAPAADN